MKKPENGEKAAFDRRSLREKRLGAGFVPLKVASILAWPQFILDKLGDISSARFNDPYLEELKRAVAANPDDRDARLNLAVTLAQYGFTEEAGAEARQAVERWPQDADARYLLGNLLADLGRDSEAEENLKKAVSLDADSPAAAFYLAEFLRQRGRMEEALELYRRAVRARELFPCAFAAFEEVLSDLGREEEALAVNDDLLTRGGEDATTLLDRGRHLLRLGRKQEAAAVLACLDGLALEEEEAVQREDLRRDLSTEESSGQR